MRHRKYTFAKQMAENEEGGKGAWTARISSPYSIASCLMAAAAAALSGVSVVQSIVTAGAVSASHAGLGLGAMAASIVGLWLGIRGKYDRNEKRQTVGLVSCVANGTLFVVLAGIYAAGLFW